MTTLQGTKSASIPSILMSFHRSALDNYNWRATPSSSSIISDDTRALLLLDYHRSIIAKHISGETDARYQRLLHQADLGAEILGGLSVVGKGYASDRTVTTPKFLDHFEGVGHLAILYSCFNMDAVWMKFKNMEQIKRHYNDLIHSCREKCSELKQVVSHLRDLNRKLCKWDEYIQVADPQALVPLTPCLSFQLGTLSHVHKCLSYSVFARCLRHNSHAFQKCYSRSPPSAPKVNQAPGLRDTHQLRLGEEELEIVPSSASNYKECPTNLNGRVIEGAETYIVFNQDMKTICLLTHDYAFNLHLMSKEEHNEFSQVIEEYKKLYHRAVLLDEEYTRIRQKVFHSQRTLWMVSILGKLKWASIVSLRMVGWIIMHPQDQTGHVAKQRTSGVFQPSTNTRADACEEDGDLKNPSSKSVPKDGEQVNHIQTAEVETSGESNVNAVGLVKHKLKKNRKKKIAPRVLKEPEENGFSEDDCLRQTDDSPGLPALKEMVACRDLSKTPLIGKQQLRHISNAEGGEIAPVCSRPISTDRREVQSDWEMRLLNPKSCNASDHESSKLAPTVVSPPPTAYRPTSSLTSRSVPLDDNTCRSTLMPTPEMRPCNVQRHMAASTSAYNSLDDDVNLLLNLDDKLSDTESVYNSSSTCMVCLAQRSCMLLMECAHLAVCDLCIPGLRECPVCERPIVHSIKIFIP
mmetsp:Transcript_3000/g.4559  ORF Transcript_3000/g.4559 Transcript_3000/m.4559 type:complete len:691 (-) Transcript_3000:66-2138(-)